MALERARAVVTGSGGGLGRAFALALGRAGGRVLVSDVDLEGAESTAARVRELGGEALVMRCDVREPAQVEALAAAMDAEWGGTDLLINNAGVAVSGPIGEAPLEDWRWVMDINVFGVVHGCHVFAPRMKAAKHGYILNVASAAGLLSPPNLGPYNVSKAAVVALTETLHAEMRPHGVHVTALCPTFFVTNIASSGRGVASEADRKAMETMMRRSKLQADDVAKLALDAVAAGRLYCVPMRDGRVFWRLKRAVPDRMPSLFGAVRRLQARLSRSRTIR